MTSLETSRSGDRRFRNMTARTKREYLRHLVAEKNKSFRPLTKEEKALGFLGWHERGYLPIAITPGWFSS